MESEIKKKMCIRSKVQDMAPYLGRGLGRRRTVKAPARFNLDLLGIQPQVRPGENVRIC